MPISKKETPTPGQLFWQCSHARLWGKCVQQDAWREGEERSSSSSHHHANSRCDKVTACKHQSNLNLAYHLPRAVGRSFPSPFGVPNASEQDRVLHSAGPECCHHVVVKWLTGSAWCEPSLVPLQVAYEPSPQCAQFTDAGRIHARSR